MQVAHHCRRPVVTMGRDAGQVPGGRTTFKSGGIGDGVLGVPEVIAVDVRGQTGCLQSRREVRANKILLLGETELSTGIT